MPAKSKKSPEEFNRLTAAWERLIGEPSTPSITENAIGVFESLTKLTPTAIRDKLVKHLEAEQAAQPETTDGPSSAKKKVQRYLLDLGVYDWLRCQQIVSNKIAYNSFKHEIQYRDVAKGILRDWDDNDDYEILLGVQNDGINASINHVRMAVNQIAKRNSFDPIMEWLEGLEWDGIPRLDRLIPDYFNSDDTAYAHAIGRMFMISAVARQYEPGCQVDHLLILEGTQGLYKTRGLEALFGAGYINDNLESLTGINASLGLKGFLVINFDELGALSPRQMKKVKSFLTRERETYIKKYQNRGTTEERRCVFVGTTNEQEYLFDEENRRYWPTKVKGKIDRDKIAEDRDQIWAEAVHCYKQNEQWWPTDEVAALCKVEQEKRQPGDPLMERLHEFVWFRKKFTINELYEGLYGESSEANRGKAANLGKKLSALGFTKSRHHGSLQYWHRPDPIPLEHQLLFCRVIDAVRLRKIEEYGLRIGEFHLPFDLTKADSEIYRIYHSMKDQVRDCCPLYEAAKEALNKIALDHELYDKYQTLVNDYIDQAYFRIKTGGLPYVVSHLRFRLDRNGATIRLPHDPVPEDTNSLEAALERYMEEGYDAAMKFAGIGRLDEQFGSDVEDVARASLKMERDLRDEAEKRSREHTMIGKAQKREQEKYKAKIDSLQANNKSLNRTISDLKKELRGGDETEELFTHLDKFFTDPE